MRFVPASAMDSSEAWKESDALLYPDGHFPTQVRGALVLDPALSTRAESEKAEPMDLARFSLIIPDPSRDKPVPGAVEGALRVLPGAATAYVLGTPYHAVDTWNFRPEINKHYRLDEAVISSNEQYFSTGPGKEIRSFVSIPVFGLPAGAEGADASPPAVVAVLNINSSEPGIFNADYETVGNLTLATAPFQYVLSILLAQLE